MASRGDDLDLESILADSWRRSSSAESGAIIDVDSLDAVNSSQQDRLKESQDADRSDDSETYTDIEEDDDDRENRFQGPSDTWRSFTKDERALAASLDQQRANDLSIHLYNAFALKARVRDPEMFPKANPHNNNKHWIRPDEDGSLPWHPDAAWTAWPVKPEDVPRRSEQFGVPFPDLDGKVGLTYRKSKAWTPSADLREEIQALMLQKAKHRFLGRKSDGSPYTANRPLQVHGQGRGKRRRVSHATSDTDQSTSSDDEAVDGDAQTVGGSLTPNEKFQDDDVEPTSLLDDDKAGEALQPNVRYILSDLDNLLMGLHTSRQYSNRHSLPRSSRTSLSRSGSSKYKKWTQDRSQPSEEKSHKSELETETEAFGDENSIEGNESEESYENESYHPNPKTSENESTAEHQEDEGPLKRKKAQDERRLKPRDWSQALGVASLTGWNQAVIDRAARRCASLFGGGMNFTEKGGSLRADGRIVKESTRVDYACPIQTCERHDEPFERAWRWREHLKRSHRFSKEQVEELEQRLRSGRR